MDWRAVRDEFPSLRDWTYLNTATYGLTSKRSRQAIQQHLDRRDELACQDFLEWFDDMDEIRGMIARLIGCAGEDVAFIVNACTGLALFLSGIDWQPGDRVATLEHEFPNQYAFAGTLGDKGVELTVLRDLTEPLLPRTRAILASTVSYVTGRRPGLARLRELADEAGALLYLDGTQSIGALPFHVAECRPDMLAVDAYKWLLTPNGAGFCYVAPELRKTLEPQVVGWRSDRDWRRVEALHIGAPRFTDAAERYEGGMLAFPSLYALGESLRLMLELGPEAIFARVRELSVHMSDVLRQAGADILHEGGNILSAGWPDRDVDMLWKSLQADSIITGVRHGRLRVSVHFYNSEEDLESLGSHLASKAYVSQH